MTHQNFSPERFSDDLSRILGITPEFLEYIQVSLKGKIVEQRCVKEFGGKTTISFTFCDQESEPKSKKSTKTQNGGKTTIEGSRHCKTHQKDNSATNSINPPRKRKSPSRRKRDRMRFRMFLEKRKKQKTKTATELSPQTTRAVSTKSPISVQCAPPDEAVITVCRPPTVVLSKSAPSSVPIPQAPDPVFPADSGSHPCICKLCHAFVDVDPIAKYLQKCDSCGEAGTADTPLKPCARCLCVAYCSKKCQTAAWKRKH